MTNGSRKTKLIAPRESGQTGHPVPRNMFDRQAVRISFPKTGRTEQSHKRACDINSIMAKFQKTGAIEHLAKHPPKYGDVSGADFTAAQVLVAQHKSVFEELPSQIRSYFENDAANYLNFVVDPANADFLEKEGLAGLLPSDEPETLETASEAVSQAAPEEPASAE